MLKNRFFKLFFRQVSGKIHSFHAFDTGSIDTLLITLKPMLIKSISDLLFDEHLKIDPFPYV